MDAYERVLAARAGGRPTASDYIAGMLTDFVELHGDRRFGDDPAMIAGIGRLEGMPITVAAIEKGHGTAERVQRNFGSCNPEGYRKAIRQFKLAEKFHRPVLCLVDTSGAYCGIGAEERGQGQAIAESMATLMRLKTPVISVIIGEGGSGGALALAVADEVWMLENAVYSVISPEGAASIIWKDSARVREASQVLKLTAEDLRGMDIVERVFDEGAGADALQSELKRALVSKFNELRQVDADALLQRRYARFRALGGAV